MSVSGGNLIRSPRARSPVVPLLPQVLRARLYDAQRLKAQAARSSSRREQIGSGDRSERIRTYNYPQGRCTDHRIGVTVHNIEGLMAGDGLDEIVDALSQRHQADLLLSMSEEGA